MNGSEIHGKQIDMQNMGQRKLADRKSCEGGTRPCGMLRRCLRQSSRKSSRACENAFRWVVAFRTSHPPLSWREGEGEDHTSDIGRRDVLCELYPCSQLHICLKGS